MNDDELIATAFTTVCDALDAVPGHYSVVEWKYANPNKVWITGPYDDLDRAQADASFFRDSPAHGPINRWHITKGGTK